MSASVMSENKNIDSATPEPKHEAPKFEFSSLWRPARVNPVNLKSYTLPILNFRDPYARNFHLAWLGFHVAFLSWFAFPPLMPEAIKSDLKLTTAEAGDSNIVALCATLIVRLVVGPMVDRFGPRKVMAALLLIGAIPSGLAGTANGAYSLYAIRFFIGILGGTFVPCQAWTTCFFDKNIVGTANALVAGWGNAGGGTTFLIMVGLYQHLTQRSGLSPHSAWRAAFAMVPVPALITAAILVLVFGTDHPAGKWEDRNKLSPKYVHEGSPEPEQHSLDGDKIERTGESDVEGGTDAKIVAVEDTKNMSEVDVAVNTPFTPKLAYAVITNPMTWLPSLSYLTTLGFELALDSNLANVLFAIYKSKNFGQTKAGYITSTFGLLNFLFRPAGGLLGDLVHRRWGVPGKKYLMLACGIMQGILCIGLGSFIDSTNKPALASVIAFVCLVALFNKMASGANFSLVPHINAQSNGLMSGIVGASGNLGGIIFALVYRFQPHPLGKATWICGVVALTVNAVLVVIRVPNH